MSRIIRMLVAVAAAGGLALLAFMTAGAASAGTYTSGAWTLIAPQTDSYSAQVQQPVNADGSSVFNHKSSTIPVQFKVTDTQSFAFESIVKGDNTQGIAPTADNAFSAAVYTPPAGTTIDQLTSLVADYSWAFGTDHGGSLRWSINFGTNKNVFVYFGDEPNTTSETPGVNGSGVNLLSGVPVSELRFDTSQLAGGTFYDSWQHAQALAAGLPISYVALVVDGGWAGDQIVNLTDASVNGNTFTMPGPVTTQTNSAPAWIVLNSISSATPGPIDESTLTSTQGDTGGQFRQVDGKYIYNLPVSNLSGTGTYSVGISLHSDLSSPTGTVKFGLR